MSPLSSALVPSVKNACWWNERVFEVEETETLTKATSSSGPKSLWSDGRSTVQHSEQQQPVR